jgi:hypothetical protein
VEVLATADQYLGVVYTGLARYDEAQRELEAAHAAWSTTTSAVSRT